MAIAPMPAPDPRAAGDPRLVPLSDPTQLGLVRFGVEAPDPDVTWRTLAAEPRPVGMRATGLPPGALHRVPVGLRGAVREALERTDPLDAASTRRALRGVAGMPRALVDRLTLAVNDAAARAAGRSSALVVHPGSLVPFPLGALDGAVPPTGGPTHPAVGRDASFLPVPPLTSGPDIWRTAIEVRDAARVASVPLTLRTLAVPPVLLLFAGAAWRPPALAVCPIVGLGQTADGLVGHLTGVVHTIDAALRLLAPLGMVVPEYADLGRDLGTLCRFLGEPGVRLLVSSEEAEVDRVGSVLAVGLPGPGFELYPRPDFGGRPLTLGATPEMLARGDFLIPLETLDGRAGVRSLRCVGLPASPLGGA